MGKQDALPDAWDDDWESQVDVSLIIRFQINADIRDKQTKEDLMNPAAEQERVPKSERLARHAESNKKLWESAWVLVLSKKLQDLS
jgi:hypothetical protein